MNKIVLYPSIALVSILSFMIAGSVYTQTTRNDTLKLCNQKPLECKFKYDILMYDETGRVPYTAPNQTPKPAEKK